MGGCARTPGSRRAARRARQTARAAGAQDINLRELTKKYGRGIGLNIGAVRAYAAQLLTALYHLRNCGVIHADIKARPARPALRAPGAEAARLLGLHGAGGAGGRPAPRGAGISGRR